MDFKNLPRLKKNHWDSFTKSQFTSCSTNTFSWHDEREWTDEEKTNFIDQLVGPKELNYWRGGNFSTHIWLCRIKGGRELFCRFSIFETNFKICEIQFFPAQEIDSYAALFLICALQINFEIDLFKTEEAITGAVEKYVLSFNLDGLTSQKISRYELSFLEGIQSSEVKKIICDLSYLKVRKQNFDDLTRFKNKSPPHPLIRLLTFGRRKR